MRQFLRDTEALYKIHSPLVPPQLDEQRYDGILSGSDSIFELNSKIKTTKSLAEYITLRQIEGREYADLITMLASDHVQAQAGFPVFARWFRKVGEVTNLVNSLHDIRQDNARGEIQIPPTLTTHFRLLGRIVFTLTQRPHPS